jgi:ABC-type nitrate/sulfonate/bicarbonate transport system substrate-binding protein
MIVGLIALAFLAYGSASPAIAAETTLVRFGVSPFQDTLVPIVGEKEGWYKQEGLDVRFRLLGWTEVMEGLSSGQIDVAISNISSIVATHGRNPDLVYWYGTNPFDNGFALMIRPDHKLKTLAEVETTVHDRNEAIRLTAAQLRGRTIITTGNTDMEQGVAAAVKRGNLIFPRDVRIIDLNPDQGLAAFLRGEGDAYIGGIPQRTRATKEGMLEMLTGSDLGPPPINGLVTTRQFAQEHQDALLKLLHVWFRTVRYIDKNIDAGGGIIISKLNASSGAQFTAADFRRFWNHYEHYPANPHEAQALILDPRGRNYWRSRWNDCNNYFFNIKKTIAEPVDAKGVFLMQEAQNQYVKRYGNE